jgi:hypothetical protein
MEAAMNRRMHPRVPITGMTADISDGKYFFSGIVHDISRSGVALEDIPQRLSARSPRLTVILDGQGGHFKLRLFPRWEAMTSIGKTMGSQIELTPESWMEFVTRFESSRGGSQGSDP